MADMGVRDRRHELRKLALYRRRSSGWPRRSSAHGTVLAVHLDIHILQRWRQPNRNDIQVGHISSCSSKHDHLPTCDESAGC